MLTLITPYQKKRQNIEDFDECSQLRSTIEKTEEGKLVQNKQSVRRWRYRSGISPTFSAAGCLVIFQAGPAAFFHGSLQTIGKPPLTT
jgi:hypothetical protein